MKTIDELRRWASSAPPGTLVPAERLCELLAELETTPEAAAPESAGTPASWREHLWTADPETRIGRDELLEAIGRPASWLYRHTSSKASDRIPHRRLDGQLVFVVGEVRRWLREREEIVEAGPLDGSRRLHSITGGGRK